MNIETSMVIEMIGRPKEYLQNTINQLMAVLESESEVKLLKKKVHEPKKIVNKNFKAEMFSTFAEVEIKCSLEKLFYIVSKYMPSHIEIISPENIKLTNIEVSTLMTEFARRLHKYDELAKGMNVKIQILENQLRRFSGPIVPANILPIPKEQGKKYEEIINPNIESENK